MDYHTAQFAKARDGHKVYWDGCLYSLDWTTGMDYWTGLLDSPKLQ